MILVCLAVVKAGREFLFCHSKASSHPGQLEHGPVLVEAGLFPAALAQIVVRKLTSQTLPHTIHLRPHPMVLEGLRSIPATPHLKNAAGAGPVGRVPS